VRARAARIVPSRLRPATRLLVAAFGAALLALALVSAGFAKGDAVEVRDGRNARANLFDIESSATGHDGAQLTHTVRTFRRWPANALRASTRRPRAICIYVWGQGRNGTGTQDYEICSHFSKRRLRGEILDVRPRMKRVATFKVKRADSRSITYTFPASAIGKPKLYRWQAISGYTGDGCRKVRRFQFGCDDSAPTGAVAVHDLRTQTKAPPEASP
jgi:hypothetical protein